MKLLTTCLTAALALTLVSAVPAFAQHRDGGSGRSSSRSVSRSSAPRSFSGRSFAAPRVLGSPRAIRAPRAAFAVRSYAAPRVIGPVRAFAAPYYVFRPRTTLSFGLVVGYPVSYPYYYAPAYVGPYPYAYPYSYPYTSVYPTPYSNASPYPAAPDAFGESGGLSFDITPGNAQVVIDGQVVGVVSSFSPTSQPLTLPLGHHRLEIRAPGYRSVVDDVDITSGEIIPFHGKLQR
jgi:hypothetical protein